MEKKINLIPAEMAVPARSVRLAKNLNKFSTISVTILLVLLVITISIYFFYNFQYKKVIVNSDLSKAKVIALEKSEQKLFLAKDRISKIKNLKGAKSVYKEMQEVQILSQKISAIPDSTLSEIIINELKTDLIIKSATTASVSEVMKTVSSTDNYKNVVLTSLTFSPVSGYVSNLTFNK